MISTALTAFSLLSAGMRWAIIGGLLLATLTTGGVIYHNIWKRGYVRAISDIAAQDNRAIERAEAARGAWKQCRDAGRRWDQSEGQCQ